MYGKDIAATDQATPVVYVQFINATGRQMTREYIVGKGADGEIKHPRLTKGTFDWTSVKEVVTAPNRPCGWPCVGYPSLQGRGGLC